MKAVVQLYKNINDSLAGLLAEGVKTKMGEANLDLALLDSMPYTIASYEDFEDVRPTIAEVGIHAFFEHKRSGELGTWTFEIYASEAFPEVYRRIVQRDLFRDEWNRIAPEYVPPFRLGGVIQ